MSSADTDLLCPLIRSSCVRDKCMMWRLEDCAIAGWLQSALFSELPEVPDDESDNDADEPGTRTTFRRYSSDEEDTLPDWFVEKSASEVAEEALTCAFENETRVPLDRLNPYMVLNALFTAKGMGHVSEYGLPTKQRAKFKEVQTQIARRFPEVAKKETERRKTNLEGYVTEVVSAAKSKNLKRLTQADVDAFFDARGERYDWEYKRQVWSAANAKLKGFM